MTVVRCRRFAVVAVVAVVAALGVGCTEQAGQVDETERNEDGEVVEGGDVGVFTLQVGDCLILPEDDLAVTDATAPPGVVDAFEAVPCDQPHTGEVVLVDDAFFADLDAFPGDDAAFEQATPACIDALDDYTGTVYEESAYDIFSLVPTDESWDMTDDRALVCIGYTLDDSLSDVVETTGSIRAAG
jgi:hypothetical protein